MAVDHPFTDPLSRTLVQLRIGNDRASTGVIHPGCSALAGVSPELDSAFCSLCHWQCRISGAWFMDKLALVANMSEARTSDRPGGEPPAPDVAVAAPPAAPRSGGAS